jgi:pimeloyl-ACP methyl ester carboxylesterase
VAGLGLLAVYLGLRAYDRPPSASEGWLAGAGLEARFATVDGVRVRYVRRGQGPPVVLLHGFASFLYTWKDVMPALAERHDVVAIDLPGFGASDQPADLTFDVLPRAVLGVMEEIGWSRASLVGNSLGGAVALVVAARHPDRVERLVLVDAAGFNLRPADRPAMVRLVSHPAAEAVVSRLPLRRLLVTLGLRQVFADDAKVTPERIDAYLAVAARPGTLAAVRSLSASSTLSPDEVERMVEEIRAPTLVVWGREDRWIPVDHADRFVAALRDGRKAVLAACGHMPQEEQPAAVARLLAEFLGTGA